LGAPLVTLFTAGIAYAIAIRVLPWAGEKTGASVPAEVEPIIVVLLLGLVTDYSVFFLSETRRRLRAGDSRREAGTAATRRPRLARRRQARILPRLRPRPRAHHADRAGGRRHARPRADRPLRRAAVR